MKAVRPTPRPARPRHSAEQLMRIALRQASEAADLKREFFAGAAIEIVICARAMAARFDKGARLFVMGDGGGSCDTGHGSVEFMHPIIQTRPALPPIALTADTAMLTAVGDDRDFSTVFAGQMHYLARRGDMILGVSTSGRAAGIIRALRLGRELGLTTIGFTGRDGGRMPELCDHCFIVPSFSIPRIRETHETLLHILWDLIHIIRGEEDVL